jgi:uncharacterized protein YdeI (YjbR/CyaY-like superfamily)
MPRLEELPVHAFATPEAFADWLAANHEAVEAIRLRIAKKGSGIASVTYAEALQVALCWGWIDGQSKSEGATTFFQRFGRRKAKSLWSKVNVAHAERLVAAGKMKPPGLAEMDRAKADGRWQAAYDPPSRAEVPPDLAASLAKSKKAAAFFATLDKQNRYAVLHRISLPKTPAGRAKRIATFVAMLAKGEKIHP